jgi:hypothetical protein
VKLLLHIPGELSTLPTNVFGHRTVLHAHALITNEFSEDVRMFLSRACTQQNKHTKP